MICGACVCVSQVTPNYTNELFLLIDYRNLLFMNLVFFIFSNRSSIMYTLLSTKYVHLMSIYIMSTKVNVIRYNTSIETPTSHQIFMPNLKKRCDIELKILHSTNIVLFTTCNKLPKNSSSILYNGVRGHSRPQ